jgi:Anti-sigma-K factor rskA/Putative zinc-finger
MTGPDHARFREDPAAFLLGALADDEQDAFELHMEQCPDCRDEVERLRPAADALPRSVEQLSPPDRLKSGLMDVVQSEAREESAQPARRRRLRDLLPGPALRPALAGGLLVLALVAGYGVAQLGSDQDQRTIAAKVDDSRMPMASAELRIEGDGDDGAVLSAEGLPDLGGRRVYQAWVLRDDKVAPAPTFVADTDGSGSVRVPDDLSGADAVLVTREPRGGARVPSENPILRVDL